MFGLLIKDQITRLIPQNDIVLGTSLFTIQLLKRRFLFLSDFSDISKFEQRFLLLLLPKLGFSGFLVFDKGQSFS